MVMLDHGGWWMKTGYGRSNAAGANASLPLRIEGHPRRLSLRELSFLRFSLQCALEGLVQGGFVFFIFFLTNAALLVFNFQVEQFVF